ncbi:2137_t:CDS:2, partial [Dentiscutata erythropus]
SIENEENEINKLVIDFTDLAIAQEINTYREIVEITLAKQLEHEQGDLNDSDEEPPNILASEELNELKNFILFAEQQISNDFDKKDLKVFQKYLLLMRQKTVELFRQKPITDFFGGVEIQNDEYSPNQDYFFWEKNFLDDEDLYDNNFYNEDPNNEGLYKGDPDLYEEDSYNEDIFDDLYDNNKDLMNDKMD